MNALTKSDAPTRAEVIRILQNSLYPGAKSESVELALSYCRVNGIDPMLKAVHIVPMWDKDARQMRDVLMPGIADYRIKASRSGGYAGKDEPEFGPDVTRTFENGTSATFPQWCKVTIYRMVGGQKCAFTAKEFWIENYATVRVERRETDIPNAMWRKRSYGQLAKCAEAQALRMAFPEFSGGQPTVEEMEGKTLDGFTGQTIEGRTVNDHATAHAINDSIPALDEAPPEDKARAGAELLASRFVAASSDIALTALSADKTILKQRDWLKEHRPDLSAQLEETIAAAFERVSPPADALGMPEASEAA